MRHVMSSITSVSASCQSLTMMLRRAIWAVHAGEASGERKGERTAPASVTFLHQLNEVQDGLLLAGTADGAVQAWRNYAHKAEQRLATAWQVCNLLHRSRLAPALCELSHTATQR